jgi:hypothetical protein
MSKVDDKGVYKMKRFFIFLSFISLFTILTACSSQTSLELVNTNVDIINDKSRLGSFEITEGDKKGQELVPTALYYEFTIKNIGNKKIGGIGDKGLQLKIEPHDSLVAASKEIIGFNIFDPNEYEETGLGYGHSFIKILEPDKKSKFILHYDLGVSEENPQVPLVPPAEKLKKLEDHALNASLIVMSGDKEIARFDLKKHK